jgi:hypothetical protein
LSLLEVFPVIDPKTTKATVTPPIHLAIGDELDRWAWANGMRKRNISEPDAVYRQFIIAENGRWALIHPDFGQSMDEERSAIISNEIALKLRRHRFNFIARMSGENEI